MKIDTKKIALILAGIFVLSGAFGADDAPKMPEKKIRVVNNLKNFEITVDATLLSETKPENAISIKNVMPQTSQESEAFIGDVAIKATAKRITSPREVQPEVGIASTGMNEETISIDLSSLGMTGGEMGIEAFGRGRGRVRGKGPQFQRKFRNNPIIYTLSTEDNTIILTFKRAGKKARTSGQSTLGFEE